MLRPIFCGNIEFESRSSDLERLFRRYGKVERVDMKSGFAFIYMDDERDAEHAIRSLDQTEFGRKGRRLRVEWTKQERGQERGQGQGQGQGQDGRTSASSKRANLKPSKTLFVINFPYHTKTRDLERHFDPYGKIVNVRIRRNFAFIQYESLEDAIKAFDATNMSKMLDRVISVEYSARGDDDRKNGYSPDRRGRDRSPDRKRRSPSPYKRERESPDYGTGSSPAAYRRERGSPVYGHGSSRSPRRVDRSSPRRVERSSPRRVERSSPRRVERSSPNGERSRSPDLRRGARASLDRRGARASFDRRSSSRSPRRVGRSSPNDERSLSPGPHRGARASLDRRGARASLDRHGSSRSPRRVERSSPNDERSRSPDPRRGARASLDRSRSPRGIERNGNSYVRHPSASPLQRDVGSPNNARRLESPGDKPDSREAGEVESPINDSYRSRSPPARERSRS